MSAIKDSVLSEIALRRGAITPEKLEQSRAAQKELEQFGITKGIAHILIEKNLATKETIEELAAEANACLIRCPSCGKQNAVSDADRQGNLKCKHCQSAVEYPSGRISEEDLTKGTGVAARPREGSYVRTKPEAGVPVGAARPVHQPHTEAKTSRNAEENDIAPRTEVTKFKLQRLVGVSPTGKLYRIADSSGLGCLKVIDRALCADKLRFKKWMDFMQKVQDLPGASTPKPVQFFREGSVSHVVRPFVGTEASTLKAKLKSKDKQGLPADTAFQCAQKMLTALQSFHSTRLVHGNLKPENVVFIEGSACLTDPGFNLLLAGLPPAERVSRLLEAERYHAPEVLLGSEPSAASDVFSAGRILEDVVAVAGGGPAGMRAWLEDVSRRMTTPDPTERFPSAREALRALEEAAKATGSSAPPPARPRAEKPAEARSPAGRKLRLASHALLVLAITFIIFQGMSWRMAKSALASEARRGEMVEHIVALEFGGLGTWTAGSSVTEAQAVLRWNTLKGLFEGTEWEQRLEVASKNALDRFAAPLRQDIALALSGAEAMAEKRQWTQALEVLLALEGDKDAQRSGAVLWERVLDGLYEEEKMVLIPGGRPGAKGLGPTGAPFLIDADLVTRKTWLLHSAEDARAATEKGAPDAPATELSYPMAEKLASSLGKRLPTGAEWDRMAALVLDGRKMAKEAMPRAVPRIQGVEGKLFQWVKEEVDDSLSQAGYGFLRGGSRPGMLPTHPLRRKKKGAVYADVGARFVRDLRPAQPPRGRG